MKKVLYTVLAVVAMTLSACGSAGGATEDSGTSNTSSSENATVIVKDSEGTEVKVPTKPKKVVVFDNGSLDTLDALGVGDAVIGAPTENLPEYLASYSDVENAGGIKEPDLEKINELQPDLIVISGRQSDFKEELSAIAPTLYLAVDGAKPWESTKENINTLATIFGKEKKAQDQIADLETQITDLKAKAADAGKALVVLVNEGQLSAFGAGSRFGIIHDTFGFAQADEQIEASTHGQSVSYEYVLEKNPDVLFVIDRTKAIGGDDSQNQVAENELVKETNAGKNGKVISLQPDVWYLSGGGLESVKAMIEDVAQAVE
ncbi:siderophore ABC transporter substrate-binding protein [Enterococcus sp. 2201sp1_2201st1_B8_2201SCRN_220225]|uniref:siderophore ABC transporter substrate-binding protein n=1 Tax=unclassified Enterococcus TaxID=2608891 RepID=UPI0034A31455